MEPLFEMIYVSTSCLRNNNRIGESVQVLAENGIKNIELSGNTRFYKGYKDDLYRLREQYSLQFLLHNYFPPPKEDFILNLASLDDDIFEKTLRHYEDALRLSRDFGACKFGLHAGYFVDFKVEEAGGKIAKVSLNDRERAWDTFRDGFNYLTRISGDVELYVENNVLSRSNADTFKGEEPFMMVDHNGYRELKSRVDFHLLLDVAHLKVSTNSLGLDFHRQLQLMLPLSDYIHLSENDGLRDQNKLIHCECDILNALKGFDLGGKTITLETHGKPEDIEPAVRVLKDFLNLE